LRVAIAVAIAEVEQSEVMPSFFFFNRAGLGRPFLPVPTKMG